MKSLIVYYADGTLRTEIKDVSIPAPGPHEVLIRVQVAGSNVKDYKHPMPALYNNAINQGDDCAGTIAAVGERVRTFRPGERVAGFHVMDAPHGTYAEFAICPSSTVFRIPADMSYEEAATLPLAAFTAAVAMYRCLNLPAPWDRSDQGAADAGKIPFVINGASSAVGSYAVKLARMNPRISPLVVTAGSSAQYVQSLGSDIVVVDYRAPNVAEDLKDALGNSRLRHVFDASNSLRSVEYLTSVMEPGARYVCTSKLYANSSLGVDDSMEVSLEAARVWYENVFVGDVHGQPFRMGEVAYDATPGGTLFGALMSRVLEKSLEQGLLTGHPHVVVSGGLHGVLHALIELKERKREGNSKFVTRIADTFAGPM